MGDDVGVSVPFVVIDVALNHGLRELLTAWTGMGTTGAALARIGATGVPGVNAVNNLPAYLALEAVAAASPDPTCRPPDRRQRWTTGPLWASLATLLWRQRCRSQGLPIRTA